MFCLKTFASSCLQADVEGIQRAHSEGHASAARLQQSAQAAQDRGQSAIAFSKQVLETLQSLDESKFDATTFVKMQDLIQRGQRESTIMTELQQLVTTSRTAATTMTESLQRGVDSLPPMLRDDLRDDDENSQKTSANTNAIRSPEAAAPPRMADDSSDADASALLQLLQHTQDDVSETQSMSRSVQQVDLFSAARQGSLAYGKVVSKQQVCGQLLHHIQQLAQTIQDALRSTAGTSCCDQVASLYSRATSLIQCLRFSKLIQIACDAALRLIQAVLDFGTAAWTKFRGFLDEFDAAKRLGRFVKGIKPLKDSKVGQAAVSMVGNFLSGR